MYFVNLLYLIYLLFIKIYIYILKIIITFYHSYFYLFKSHFFFLLASSTIVCIVFMSFRYLLYFFINAIAYPALPQNYVDKPNSSFIDTNSYNYFILSFKSGRFYAQGGISKLGTFLFPFFFFGSKLTGSVGFFV